MKNHGRQRFYAGAAWLFAPLWVFAAEPDATTVYRTVGPDGVVAFSDTRTASAVAVEVVPPPTPMREDVERANEQFQQQLALLEVLETSREARAKEALEQQKLELDYVRTAAAQQRAREREAERESTSYYPLFIGPYRRPPHVGPRPHPHPPHRPDGRPHSRPGSPPHQPHVQAAH